MRIGSYALVVALVAAPAALRAQAVPADTTRLGTDPQVTAGVLANGMHYYIRANHKPEKRA